MNTFTKGIPIKCFCPNCKKDYAIETTNMDLVQLATREAKIIQLCEECKDIP